MERRKKSSSRLNGSIFTREERRQRAVNCGDCRQKSSLLRGAVGGGSLLNGQPPPPQESLYRDCANARVSPEVEAATSLSWTIVRFILGNF